MFELRIWDTGNLCNFPYLPDEKLSDGWSTIEVLEVESIEGVKLYASSVTNEEGMQMPHDINSCWKALMNRVL